MPRLFLTLCLLLSLLATAVPAGEAKAGSLAWSLAQAKSLPEWRTPAPGAPVAGDPAQAAFDDAAWKPRTLPWDWTGAQFSNDTKKPPSGSFDAVSWGGEVTGLKSLWFRTRFDLPAEWRGKELVLALGAVGDQDETWVNGKKVGGRCDPFADRSYRLPASLLKEKDNLVAVFVRHEAPGVQQAHMWYFWGHKEIGDNAFWPAGIHERAPSIRPISTLEAAAPRVEPGLPCLADVQGPPNPEAGKPEPVYELRLDLGRPGGAPFFQSGSNRADLLVTLNAAAGLVAERLPDAVRVTAVTIDGGTATTRDLPATVVAGQALELKATLNLPDVGWYRLTATPLLKGRPIVFADGKLGGRTTADFAIFLPQIEKLLLDSRFGICGEATPASIPAITAIGARWLRWDLPWDRFEHEQGKYTFNDNVELWGGVKQCQQHQVAMMPVFGYCAAWAVHPEVKGKKDLYWLFSPPADPEAFGRAAKRLAEEFKGVIQAYEIWNEPALGHFLIGVEGMNGIGTYIKKVYPYAARGIRAGDPKAKIIYASQWAEPFADGKGAIPDFAALTDGAGLHPYCADDPELGSFARIGTAAMGAVGVASAGTWKKEEGDTVSWFAPAQPGRYAIWNTESGWFPADVQGELAALSKSFNRRTVASFIPRAFCAAAWRGQERFFLFALHELFSDEFRQPRPAALAYCTTSAMLEHAKPSFLQYPRRGLPCYVWQRSDDPQRFVGVIWSQGLDQLCILPDGLTARDLMGRLVKPRENAVRVGEEALFLEATAASPLAARKLFAAIQAVGLGNGSTLNLWMRASEAESWRKRITAADAPVKP